MNKKRSLWLSRSFCFPGPYLAFCATEEDFKKCLKDLKIEEKISWIKEGFNAATHEFVNTDGKTALIVSLDTSQQKSNIEIAALLVHEAVHIWQIYMESLNEKKPGSEIEAYGIQAISTFLFSAYQDYLVLGSTSRKKIRKPIKPVLQKKSQKQ
jgi:hypothetical protein